MEDDTHNFTAWTIQQLGWGRVGGIIQTSQKAVVVARCGERVEELTKSLSLILFSLKVLLFSFEKGVFDSLLFKSLSPFHSCINAILYVEHTIVQFFICMKILC